MPEADSLDLAYLAGFFDGEGCVHINKPDPKERQALVVRVTQTEPGVLLGFQDRWGGTLVTRDNGPRRKPIWWWTVGALAAKRCLEDLLPYLRVKSAHAAIGIQFQELKEGDNNLMALKSRHPRREEIMQSRRACQQRLSTLNQRGR